MAIQSGVYAVMEVQSNGPTGRFKVVLRNDGPLGGGTWRCMEPSSAPKGCSQVTFQDGGTRWCLKFVSQVGASSGVLSQDGASQCHGVSRWCFKVVFQDGVSR